MGIQIVRRAVVVAAGLLLSGCSSIPLIGSIYEPGPDKIAMSIDQYCKRVSAGGRSAFRASVNAEAAPHSIYIWCHGGQPPWIPDERWAEWLKTPKGETWFNSTLEEVTQ